jgi:putative transposase
LFLWRDALLSQRSRIALEEYFMNELNSYQHSVAQVIYHLQWATKYRYNMFRQPKYAILCDNILRGIAQRHGMQVIELTVASDHVHAVIKAKPSMSSSECLRLLKGASSHELFKQVPNYRLRYKRGHLWSGGNFMRTVGSVDLETTNRYVAQQRTYKQAILSDYAN